MSWTGLFGKFRAIYQYIYKKKTISSILNYCYFIYIIYIFNRNKKLYLSRKLKCNKLFRWWHFFLTISKYYENVFIVKFLYSRSRSKEIFPLLVTRSKVGSLRWRIQFKQVLRWFLCLQQLSSNLLTTSTSIVFSIISSYKRVATVK